MDEDSFQYFTCIGPIKTGTTWLYNYLSKCATAHLPTIKEIRWFNQNFREQAGLSTSFEVGIARAQALQDRKGSERARIRLEEVQERDRMKTDEDYRNFFTKRYSKGDVAGDISPGYATLALEDMQRIKTTFPNAKVIFIMRNPVDHVWSRVYHKFFKSGEPSPHERMVLELEQGDPHHASDFRAMYNKVFDVFDQDSVKLMFTEDIFSPKQDKTIADLLAFLGVEKVRDFEEDFSNSRSKSDKMSDSMRDYAAQIYAEQYMWAQQTFSYLPEKWRKEIKRLDI